MKRLLRVISFGILGLGSLAAAAQVTVVIAPRPVFVHRPPIVAVRPVAVFPRPIAYRPYFVPRPIAYGPVFVPRPYYARRYYPAARPFVYHRRAFVYRAGPVHRTYWRHERWEHRHGRW